MEPQSDTPSMQTDVLVPADRREVTVIASIFALSLIGVLAVQIALGRDAFDDTTLIVCGTLFTAAFAWVRSRQELTVGADGLAYCGGLPGARFNWRVLWTDIATVVVRRNQPAALSIEVVTRQGARHLLPVGNWVIKGDKPISMQRRLQAARRKYRATWLERLRDPFLTESELREVLAEVPLYAILAQRGLIDAAMIPVTTGYHLDRNPTMRAILIGAAVCGLYVVGELMVARYGYASSHAYTAFFVVAVALTATFVVRIARTDAPFPETLIVSALAAPCIAAALYFVVLRLNALPGLHDVRLVPYQTRNGNLVSVDTIPAAHVGSGPFRPCLSATADGRTVRVSFIDGPLGFTQVDKRALHEALREWCD